MGIWSAVKRSIVGSNHVEVPHCVGPFLRFGNLRAEDGTWTGSVLVLVSKDKYDRAPVLLFQEIVSKKKVVGLVNGSEIDSMFGYAAYRFNLTFKQHQKEEKQIRYCIKLNNGSEENDSQLLGKIDDTYLNAIMADSQCFSFYIPRAGQDMRWYFVSCNGVTDNFGRVDASQPQIHSNWWDIFQSMAGCHDDPSKRYHLGVNIGDQLYADNVFELKSVKWYLDNTISKQKLPKDFEISNSCLVDIERFYFTSYCQHFSQDVWSYILASVPQIMIWDDHDIFDGYGSYPESIQQHPLVQNIFDIASRFYLLFQHHTNKSRLIRMLDNPEMFGAKSYNFFKRISSNCAILGIETRSDRSIHQCVDRKTFGHIEGLLRRNSGNLKHLIVIFASPIVWPSVFIGEAALKVAGFIQKRLYLQYLLKKSKLYRTLLSPFGNTFDLMDDLLDQWNSRYHMNERKNVITFFQNYSKSFGVRTTFISGDVHAAGVGKLSSVYPPGSDVSENLPKIDLLCFDHRLIYNVTSSPVVNNLPTKSVVKLLHLSAVLSYKESDSKESIKSRSRTAPIELTEKLYRECVAQTKVGDYDLCCRALLSHKDTPYVNKFLIPTVTSYLETNENTKEELLNLFVYDVDGTPRDSLQTKIMDRRNWCEVVSIATDMDTSSLEFKIHVEKFPISYRNFHEAVQNHVKSAEYSITVPPLLNLKDYLPDPSVSYLDEDEDTAQTIKIDDAADISGGCLPLGNWMGISWHALSRKNKRNKV